EELAQREESVAQSVLNQPDSIHFYNYNQLAEMGYRVEDMIHRTVSLSAGGISGYLTQDDESNYWMQHRYANMSFFVCAMYAGVLLGHFSAMRIRSDEAEQFLNKQRAETEFSVLTAEQGKSTSYFLYISAVVVRPCYRNSRVPLRLIRAGYRLLMNHLESHEQALGIVAEAYSKEGRRMCQLFKMSNVSENF